MNGTTPSTAPSRCAHAAPQHPDLVGAALLMFERMGLSPADLADTPRPAKLAPTFADYVPIVAAAVGPRGAARIRLVLESRRLALRRAAPG